MRADNDNRAGDRLLRLRDVQQMTTLGRTTIYRFMAAGRFPRPLDVGVGCSRWRESQIVAWMDALPVRAEA
ncbi:helix-turn-helix transcriptional regulator [Methylopila henanensis]|uniref:Helix-turn-helix transcriptional regulator n=1 Tax=Methylopila henanensis TaxID=873516 RepID=A0ABW4K2I3_9HYPH